MDLTIVHNRHLSGLTRHYNTREINVANRIAAAKKSKK